MGIGKELLLEHEGMSLDPYRCTSGYLTGGVGHKMSQEDIEDFNPCWNDQRKWKHWILKFDEDYERASVQAVRLMYRYDIAANMEIHSVLTDMIFNMGYRGVTKFVKFLKALSEKDTEKAVYEMYNSLWYKQVGRRVDNLAKIVRDNL